MNELFTSGTFFGLALTLVLFFLSAAIIKKFRIPILNPLLMSMFLIIIVLVVFNIDFETYNQGAKFISALLTPATICYAIPLYRQLKVLKKNVAAILIGIASGVIVSAASILILAKVFGLSDIMFATIFPKSVTAAVAMSISEQLGGIIAATSLATGIAGLFGSTFAVAILKIFRIKEPVAKGLACGTSCHAMGTASAMQMGEVEGATSGLAVVIAGLMTVLVAQFIMNLY